MTNKIYTIKIAYQTEFEIEAENRDDAEAEAAKEFWNQAGKASLVELEITNEEEFCACGIELNSDEEQRNKICKDCK